MEERSRMWPPPIEAKQSITEVLQNPRGELRDSLDFRGAPPPPPPPRAPPDAEVTINDFASYLRELAPLYDEAPLEAPVTGEARARTLGDVPHAYYDEAFGVAKSEDLAGVLASDEGGALDKRRVSECRGRLAAREDAVRAELQDRLRQRSHAVDDALAEVRLLRARVLTTAREVAEARQRAKEAVDAVAQPVTRIADVVAARRNALNVLETLRMVKRVRAAAGDVPVLLDTGQYAAAIDAVHSARDALQSSELRGVHALAAARARLARAVESIDARLRADFRVMTRDDEAFDETQVLVVADLCARIGRMEVLRTTYLDDTASALSKELEACNDVSTACTIVRARVGKAAKVLHALHGDEENARINALHRLFADAQECMCAVLDRLLGTFSVSDDISSGAYIVIQPEDKVTEVSCFDEAKAAIKFTELMRSLNTLGDDVAREIGLDEASTSALQAKCRERVLAFIDAFHKAHVDAVTSTVRADEWKEVIVSEGTSRLVLSVAGSDESPTPHQVETPPNKPVAGPIPTPRNNPRGKPKRIRIPLKVNGEVYYSVRCGLRFARSLCAYALVVDKIPMVGSAAARRGVELSILFNSLVCQAILGAAALEWAGIKTITARHLALASRTVALAHLLSAAVHETFESVLPDAQLAVVRPLMRKATDEFSDSRRQTLAKILTIMMQRLAAHEATCKTLPWNKKGDLNRLPTPSPYMDRLVLESDLLHRILWQILPPDEVATIFEKVCNAFANRLDAVYRSCDRSKPWVAKRITSDSSHLFSQLLKLDVFDSSPDSLEPVKLLFKNYSKAPVPEHSESSAPSSPAPAEVEELKSSCIPVVSGGLDENESEKQASAVEENGESKTSESIPSDTTEVSKQPEEESSSTEASPQPEEINKTALFANQTKNDVDVDSSDINQEKTADSVPSDIEKTEDVTNEESDSKPAQIETPTPASLRDVADSDEQGENESNEVEDVKEELQVEEVVEEKRQVEDSPTIQVKDVPHDDEENMSIPTEESTFSGEGSASMAEGTLSTVEDALTTTEESGATTEKSVSSGNEGAVIEPADSIEPQTAPEEQVVDEEATTAVGVKEKLKTDEVEDVDTTTK